MSVEEEPVAASWAAVAAAIGSGDADVAADLLLRLDPRTLSPGPHTHGHPGPAALAEDAVPASEGPGPRVAAEHGLRASERPGPRVAAEHGLRASERSGRRDASRAPYGPDSQAPLDRGIDAAERSALRAPAQDASGAPYEPGVPEPSEDGLQVAADRPGPQALVEHGPHAARHAGPQAPHHATCKGRHSEHGRRRGRSGGAGPRGGRVRSDDDPGDAALFGLLADAMAGRTAEWRAEFATLAALKLVPGPRRRGGPGQGVRMVLALLRHTGVVPPVHDPLVLTWAACTPDAAALRADPLLDHLVPRLFDADGVGALLRDERSDPPKPRSWLAALHELAADGRIERDLLLDGCLRRFLRGGQPADLRFFVRLHELLQPTYDEVSGRRSAYLELLSAAPGAVAETVLRHVRRLGDLEPGEVTGALRALLSRRERKLQTAGVTWLDEVAAADPAAGLDELASALGRAFGSESADVQGRAVRVAVKHAKRFTADGARAIREAAQALPQELRETLAAVFGGKTGEGARHPDGFRPVPLPEPLPVGAFPSPVRAAYELDPWPGAGWQDAERWLAGVVHLYGHDPIGLAARLTTRRPPPNPPSGPWLDIDQWAQAITRLILTLPRTTRPRRGAATRLSGRTSRVGGGVAGDAGRGGDGSGTTLAARGAGIMPGARAAGVPPAAREVGVAPGGQGAVAAIRAGEGDVGFGESGFGVAAGAREVGGVSSAALQRLPQAGDVPGPHLFLLRRWAEVHDALAAGTPPPYLLAEPTDDAGGLDPAVLVERLAGYERAGAEALPADLQQALLRLPRVIPQEVVVRAAGLTSKAGRAAARWMTGGRPEPVAELLWWCPILGGPGVDLSGAALTEPALAKSGASGASGPDLAEAGPYGVSGPGLAESGVSGVSGSGLAESGSYGASGSGVAGAPGTGTGAARHGGPGGEGAGRGRGIGGSAGEAAPHDRWQCCAARAGRVHELGARLRLAAPTGLALVDGLLGGSAAHGLRDHGGYLGWWPYLMPSDREAVAAYFVPHLMERWRRARVEAAQAPALAAAGGPPGDALALVVAYLAADRSRAAAKERARPVVELAARGELDAERVGRRLALLLRRTELKPGPAFETLEAAAALGAQREVWRIMTAFLPGFLPGPGERPHTRHTQGLVFALRAARWAGARGAVPCVAEIAGRKASNTFVREARRLHTYLT
ncbi:DUF6493 family protein [Nonomuraea sp. N2-4H]|uniref:DUF6493 family protein n=1 Tax=Nonomuraea sp. N2-4H TaxID=3128898 RepID=UPI0032454C05